VRCYGSGPSGCCCSSRSCHCCSSVAAARNPDRPTTGAAVPAPNMTGHHRIARLAGSRYPMPSNPPRAFADPTRLGAACGRGGLLVSANVGHLACGRYGRGRRNSARSHCLTPRTHLDRTGAAPDTPNGEAAGEAPPVGALVALPDLGDHGQRRASGRRPGDGCAGCEHEGTVSGCDRLKDHRFADGLKPGRHSLELVVEALPGGASPTFCLARVGASKQAQGGRVTISGKLPARLGCHMGEGILEGYVPVRAGKYTLSLGVPDRAGFRRTRRRSNIPAVESR
jgi:hypothetical protein